MPHAHGALRSAWCPAAHSALNSCRLTHNRPTTPEPGGLPPDFVVPEARPWLRRTRARLTRFFRTVSH